MPINSSGETIYDPDQWDFDFRLGQFARSYPDYTIARRVRMTFDAMRNGGWNGSFQHIRHLGLNLHFYGVSEDEQRGAGYIPPQTEETVDSSAETLCYCEACKQKRYEKADLTRRRVHNYTYTPARWREHRVDGDKFPYLMGVELETTAHQYDHLDNGFAVDMRRPKQFWIAKRDGSVSGPEFVSHPATLTFWHQNEGNLRDMFKMLTHAGFTSHTGAQAGMHVNISRTAFSDASHLFRFLRLVTMRPEWSIKMAQRSVDKAQSWATIRPYDMATCEAAMGGSRYLTNKYSVVNIQRTRYEFRLPRGTLRIDRFFKNLEWTAAMIGFARQVTEVAEINPDNFGSWVSNYPTVYTNLLSFIEEKKEVLTAALDINSDVNRRFSHVTA